MNIGIFDHGIDLPTFLFHFPTLTFVPFLHDLSNLIHQLINLSISSIHSSDWKNKWDLSMDLFEEITFSWQPCLSLVTFTRYKLLVYDRTQIRTLYVNKVLLQISLHDLESTFYITLVFILNFKTLFYFLKIFKIIKTNVIFFKYKLIIIT